MPAPRKQEQEPAATDVVEVSPGILRLQLPISLPGLGHVNAYALIDRNGAAIIDPGLPGPPTWRALKHRLGQAGLRIRDVHTVFVTHSHPDHFGSAGRLAQAADAELVTHSAFRTWWAKPCADHGDHDVHDVDPSHLPIDNPWRQPAPWGGGSYRAPIRRRIAFRLMRSALGAFRPPCPTRRVRDGEVVRLGSRELLAVHTPGHTLDHLCLHDPEAGVTFTGDHVLPTITPHISGIAAGPDPLSAFFASLDKVAECDRPGSLALPAHGHPFADLAGRAAAIKEHHRGRLQKLVEGGRASGPASVAELSRHLFRPARLGQMADSETYAHLEHLRAKGQADRREERGRVLYEMR